MFQATRQTLRPFASQIAGCAPQFRGTPISIGSASSNTAKMKNTGANSSLAFFRKKPADAFFSDFNHSLKLCSHLDSKPTMLKGEEARKYLSDAITHTMAMNEDFLSRKIELRVLPAVNKIADLQCTPSPDEFLELKKDLRSASDSLSRGMHRWEAQNGINSDEHGAHTFLVVRLFHHMSQSLQMAKSHLKCSMPEYGGGEAEFLEMKDKIGQIANFFSAIKNMGHSDYSTMSALLNITITLDLFSEIAPQHKRETNEF